MNKKDFTTLVNCLEQRTRDDGTKYICRKDDTPAKILLIIQEIMFKNSTHNFDLDYEIFSDALNVLHDVDYKDLENFDIYENTEEYASVYTAVRLSYLNNWTQNEISDKQKEYGCDIETACAVWYDEQVLNIINELVEIIKYD